MSKCVVIGQLPPLRCKPRRGGHTVYLLAMLFVAMAPLFAFTTTAARACACGCSVFDVGGGLLPRENDHGGRLFLAWRHADQQQNWIGEHTSEVAL